MKNETPEDWEKRFTAIDSEIAGELIRLKEMFRAELQKAREESNYRSGEADQALVEEAHSDGYKAGRLEGQEAMRDKCIEAVEQDYTKEDKGGDPDEYRETVGWNQALRTAVYRMKSLPPEKE